MTTLLDAVETERQTVLRWWPIVLILVSLATAGVKVTIAIHDHVVTDQAQSARIEAVEQRNRELVHVILSEHPDYTEVFYPLTDKGAK